MMKLNRTYLQKRLKNNLLAKLTYEIFVMHNAKRFLDNKSQWKFVQEGNLKKILGYACEHTAYYKSLYSLNQVENPRKMLASLPLLDKAKILNIGGQIYSDEISDDWKLWLNTGGSTGEPLHFPALYKSMPWEFIVQMMLYLQMGYKIGDSIVCVSGERISDEDIACNIYWEEGTNFPWGKVHFSTLHLNPETIGFYWDKLLEVKPKFMRGYPSGILELCKLAQKYGLSPLFKMKGIYLTSENFTQDEKNFISDFFHCPVYGQYGHTESSIFAVQKPDSDAYYTNPLYGYTEVLDESGKQVGIGECGEIVVTGFIEYGLPFIRYKTGDLAVYGGETEFGETILTRLLGRNVDFIFNKKGEKIFLVGFVFGGHIKAFNHILAWQIQQSEMGKVTLLVVKGDGYDEDVENEVKQLFDSKDIDVEFQYVRKIEKTKRGKQKFLIQELK